MNKMIIKQILPTNTKILIIVLCVILHLVHLNYQNLIFLESKKQLILPTFYSFAKKKSQFFLKEVCLHFEHHPYSKITNKNIIFSF